MNKLGKMAIGATVVLAVGMPISSLIYDAATRTESTTPVAQEIKYKIKTRNFQLKRGNTVSLNYSTFLDNEGESHGDVLKYEGIFENGDLAMLDGATSKRLERGVPYVLGIHEAAGQNIELLFNGMVTINGDSLVADMTFTKPVIK